MLTEPQRLWVEALESGEFKPTQGTLENDERFSCLGVACKVAEKHGINVVMDSSGKKLFGADLSTQPEVMKWLNLKNCSGALGNDGPICVEESKSSFITKGQRFSFLTSYNDFSCDPELFKTIASIIRSEPKELFVKENKVI